MSTERRGRRDLDWVLLSATLALALIGVFFVQSATLEGMGGAAGKQAAYLGLGVVGMAVLLRIDYRRLSGWAPWLYGAGLVLNVAVLLLGVEVGGNRAWLRVGSLSIQPSEPMKLATVLMVAHVRGRLGGGLLRARDALAFGLVVGVPMGLILLQDDTGTALTYAPLLAGAIFVSGLRWRWIVAGAVALALVAPIGWSVLKPYQKERVRVVFDPDRDPSGIGYQADQCRTAVGSGGLTGQGYMKGPQNRLGFLPARHTDFIFAVLAEETGFLGSVLVLALYLLVIKRISDAMVLARDRVGAFACLGAMAFLTAHVVVNVGMVLGLLPVIGLPLPLLSFGGSSLIASLGLVALALNVRMNRLVA